jgi:hypothetical protein
VKARRNEVPHSGVLSSVTAEGGKQSQRPRVNLNSGNGSEEDGVENRSEPQGWLADGSPGSTGSTKDAENAAGVQTVPPLFGMGPAASAPAEKEQSSAPDDAPAPGPDDHQGWAPRIPEPPLSGNGAVPSSSTTVPATNWPPSPANSQNQGSDVLGPGGPPLNGPGAPPLPGRYSPPDGPRDFSAGTATFPKAPKGKIRPPRPAKSSRPSKKKSGSDWSSAQGLPSQGAPSSRKAQLAIARIEPWSVMKFSFMISLVGWVILFVAVAVMYFVLKKIGVFTSIEHTVGLVTSTKEHAGADAASWFSASRVLGYTMLVGAVNVILITALSTVGAVLYNLVTMIAGGVEVTLKEAE